MSPTRFAQLMKEGTESGEIAFTAKADLSLVVDQYRIGFEQAHRQLTDGSNLPSGHTLFSDKAILRVITWGDEEALQCAEAIDYLVQNNVVGSHQLSFVFPKKEIKNGTSVRKARR